MNIKTVVFLLITLLSSGHAFAGLIGDAIEIGCGNCGVGKALDKKHREIKHNNPGYGKAEEKLTNNVRKSLGLKPHCEPLYNKWGDEVSCS